LHAWSSFQFLPIQHSILKMDALVLVRNLGLWSNYTYFWNSTFDQADEFTSQLRPASDVSVHAVMSSLYFNAIIFVFLLASYEILRRIIPSVYAARKLYSPEPLERPPSGIQNLPFDSYMPLDWVAPVFGVSWLTVRKTAGLDAYFFLRFIRMCVRITGE
jgi:Late exocytosis, associated with Golgi transport